MSQIFAYQIGGIFLLAALFMLGTAAGLVPKLFRGNVTGVLGGIVALGFVLYFYGPEALAWWRSSPSPVRASTPPPAPAAAVHGARPRGLQPLEPAPKVIVWTDDIPVAQAKAADPQPAVKSEPAPAPEPTLTADEGGSSPYDSKAKRAIKSIGRALHIHKPGDQ